MNNYQNYIDLKNKVVLNYNHKSEIGIKKYEQ